ncbi:hypothetical protein FN846DRAFT_976005 [Sphaerosporella brunnea]|uniref:Uncharacterized protein n=1 Tax=Sphaerosporella brunnea TaxID=1250544 RepID=A0A5J5EEJ9_9PEZI|nr:hypothetical protein FN846DRAFT_976005 [Sphaerosporella brunnea]
MMAMASFLTVLHLSMPRAFFSRTRRCNLLLGSAEILGRPKKSPGLWGHKAFLACFHILSSYFRSCWALRRFCFSSQRRA